MKNKVREAVTDEFIDSCRLRPVSRKDAPDTSKEAESRITKSGKRQSDLKLVRTAVETHEGHTARELYEYYLKQEGLDRHGVSSRLAESKDLFVIQGDKRKCEIAKTNAVTWWRLRP